MAFSKKYLCNDAEYLLEFMDTIPSDGSDCEFDGYADDFDDEASSSEDELPCRSSCAPVTAHQYNSSFQNSTPICSSSTHMNSSFQNSTPTCSSSTFMNSTLLQSTGLLYIFITLLVLLLSSSSLFIIIIIIIIGFTGNPGIIARMSGNEPIDFFNLFLHLKLKKLSSLKQLDMLLNS